MARLADDPTGLTCTRPHGHPQGHVYIADWSPDHHDTTEPHGDDQ